MIILCQFLAICQGGGEGHFIGVFDVASGGHAPSDAGDLDMERFQLLFQVESGHIAFRGRIGRQDDFLYSVILYPLEEFVDAEITAIVAPSAFQEAA